MTEQKFWAPEHPPVVLVAGPEDATAGLRSALAAATEFRVEALADASAVLDRLERRPPVDALVLTDLLDADLLDTIERAAAVDAVTSVVAAPTDGSERLAGRATAAGADEYVPGDASTDARRRRVQRAVRRAIERRHDALKRSALDAMLSDLDAEPFVADERGRTLLDADREPVPDAAGTDTEAAGSTERANAAATELATFDSDGETGLRVYDAEHAAVQAASRADASPAEPRERADVSVESDATERGWQWVATAPWRVDGEVRGRVGLSLDVTDWKRRERDLLRQVGRLQQLPDYLVHDLRNPLGVARGYLDLARDGDAEAVDVVSESLDRMEELLEEFHSLATHGADTDLATRPVELGPLVRECWRSVSTAAGQLDLDLPPGTRVVADEGQLRSLLLNLLDNAVDHAGSDVAVELGLLEEGFYVADDGPGVAPTIRDELFEYGTSTSSEGPGLGLAIVEEAALLHGWDVSVGESERGGARFEVRDCLVGSPLDAAATGRRVHLSESVDVGDVAVAGSTSRAGDRVQLVGAGRNVWRDDSELHFHHVAVEGGVRIQGRVAELETINAYSKAGLLVRSDLDEDAAYAAIGLVGGQTPEVLWRPTRGVAGRSDQVEGLPASYDWFRLDRVGDEVATFVSRDGEEWLPVDRRTIGLGATPHVGLFVCSTVRGSPIEATFEDVEVVALDG